METNELQELLLTAQVRTIAGHLRDAAARKAAHGSSNLEADFRAAHSADEYMAAGLAELKRLRALMLAA